MKTIKRTASYPLSPRQELIRRIRFLPNDKVELLLNTAKSFKTSEPAFNAETIAALEETNRIALDPSVKGYTDIDKMMKELLT